MRDFLLIPGPNPNVCTCCEGPMRSPHFGRHTKVWIRSCRECGERTYTRQAPAFATPRGPLGRADFGYLEFDDRPIMRPKTRPTRFDPRALPADARRAVLDVKQRQTGERS